MSESSEAQVTLGPQAIDWYFIVSEISEDEGILGNDFAVARQLTLRPHEGAVYLPRAQTTSTAGWGSS